MAKRVWDDFLTEQDKAQMAVLGERKRKPAFGSRPAILNVDNYRSVAGDQPMDILEMVKTWPGSMGYAAWTALDHIADLLATARGAGMPVSHVHGLPVEDSAVDPWRGGVKNLDDMTAAERDRHLRRFDFMPQAAPVPGEIVLKKVGPSAFYGTPLISGLTALGVDTLIVTGESTSGCVRASVVDAMSNGFKVVIPEECVYDRHQACHAINLFDMHQKYATVLPLAEVKAWIEQWAAATTKTPALAAV